MSRTAAIQHAQGRRIDRELADKGIIAKCRSWKGLAEEQPAAYKDVSHVVDVVARAGAERFVSETHLSPGGTVGKHLRHVLEFHEGLFHGLPARRVVYARRVRDAAVVGVGAP